MITEVLAGSHHGRWESRHHCYWHWITGVWPGQEEQNRGGDILDLIHGDERDKACEHTPVLSAANVPRQRFLCVSFSHVAFSFTGASVRKELRLWTLDVAAQGIRFCRQKERIL